MNVEKLKKILIDANIYRKETSKNLICKCYICGDHPDERKQKHLYVSTDPSIPVCHCFFSGCSVPISKLIVDLTGNKNLINDVLTVEEQKKLQNVRTESINLKNKTVEYKLPLLDTTKFITKKNYIEKRCNQQISCEKIPGLVFDFCEFFKVNNLETYIPNVLTDKEYILLQKYFVGFLGRHRTHLYCRSIDDSLWFKFKKIFLQNGPTKFLDYWTINQNTDNDLIILAEGIFDILGEFASDSLQLKNKVRLYAAGNSFSYQSLLKSVCFDENLFRCNVIILSDSDKSIGEYTKLKQENTHVLNSIRIFYNSSGKDFGIYPQKPVEVKIKETQNFNLNKNKRI